MVNFIKKQKLVLILLMIASLVATGFAFAQGDKKAEEPQVMKLSLADALKMAEQNNPQVALSKLAVEKAELAQKELKYREKKDKESEEESNNAPSSDLPQIDMFKISTSDFDYKYNMEMGKKSAEFGIEMAQASVDATLRNIRFGVEAAYYGALAAEDNLKISQDALKRQEEMLKIAEVKFKTGMIAKRDLMDAQVQVAQAQAAVSVAEQRRQKAYINLKKLLSIDLEKQIELTDAFEYKPVETLPDIEKLLKDALENRMDIIQAQGKLDIAQLDFDLTSRVYPSNTFKYKEKEYALQDAKINLENKKKDMEAEVRGILLDLQEAGANIPVLDKSVELARESLRLAKLSYEVGMVRSVDVSQAEEMLKQVELQRNQAIYNYNLAKIKLENVVYIPVSGGSLSGGETPTF
ncbi:MAG TPA: TolC family protein [Thermoanaerobacterales bacterium]|nr:TolC family protein [Thermoanaerobacterales bacterium]